MEKAVILEGARTAFGSFGGALKDTSAIHLGVQATKALLERSGIAHTDIDEIIIGNVIQTEPQSMYTARHIGLHAGLEEKTPALTVNRLCGSGMEAALIGAMGILLGTRRAVIAGGVENMSQSPYIATGARWGNRFGTVELVDMLHAGLNDAYVNQVMGNTAENLAEQYQISREEQDEWTLISHARARESQQNGVFGQDIVKIRVRKEGGRGEFTEDECVRTNDSLQKLSKLPPVYKQGGTVTAGNASGLNDGASVMLLSSESYAKEKGLRPLARILGWGHSGCDPKMMGLGPVYAIPKALAMAGLEMKDMELVEINEAFAAQFLAVKKILNLDPERTNVNGGALALGHPLGASGNRILLSLARELRRRGARYGVASLCIGGGQGIATVVESLPA
jgi:acetyl-CoA C-acetyltransferase